MIQPRVIVVALCLMGAACSDNGKVTNTLSPWFRPSAPAPEAPVGEPADAKC